MKYIKALDLLRQRIIFVPQAEDIELHSKEYILAKKETEVSIAKILDFVLSTENKKEEIWSFEKKVTPEELRQYEAKQEKEKERITLAQKLIDELQLPMRVFSSRMSWNDRIIAFFFTCEDTVDFRELLKIMGSEFKCRVHLERVGARDKAKIVGGFGVCGREVCCASFKNNIVSVPMDAVRDQGVMIKENNKLLGGCGKLKCCFLYELPIYREMRKTLPHIRQTVWVERKHKARVIGLDILNQKVKVLMEETEVYETFDVSEVSIDAPLPPKEHVRRTVA
jgi:cell fate regulator YaaT (PSP1 superfamily)